MKLLTHRTPRGASERRAYRRSMKPPPMAASMQSCDDRSRACRLRCYASAHPGEDIHVLRRSQIFTVDRAHHRPSPSDAQGAARDRRRASSHHRAFVACAIVLVSSDRRRQAGQKLRQLGNMRIVPALAACGPRHAHGSVKDLLGRLRAIAFRPGDDADRAQYPNVPHAPSDPLR